MICSLILGRKGSLGFPDKNLYPIGGKPLAWYPMHAASCVDEITHNFISTDDPRLMDIASGLNFKIIERPPELATAEALGEDAYVHGYEQIKIQFGIKPDILVLLFCNAPTVNPTLIIAGINTLKDNPKADSAVTVSKYNMFSPTRARKLDSEGLLKPYIPFDLYPDGSEINCDRDSQGDVWFADVGLSVIRARNLDDIESGLLPQKWMGRNIMPIYNEAGLDLDYTWQLGQAEWWLKNKRKSE